MSIASSTIDPPPGALFANSIGEPVHGIGVAYIGTIFHRRDDASALHGRRR